MSAGEEALPQPGPEAAVAEAGTEDPATLSCEALRREGNLLYKQRRWDAACKHYTRALQRFDEGLESAGGDEGGTGGVDSSSSSSGRTNCLLNRAACYLKMERHGSAVKDCTQAIAADPKIAKAWYRRGEARYHMKLVDEARDDLAEALRLAPKDDQVRSLYEKAKKACTEGNDTRYWMENFDFSTGMFKQRLASSISPGEQFFRAASANDVGRLQALAELGAAQCDVNTRVNGYTALMSAASKGLTEAVSALLALPGVGRLESTEDGSTALHLAAADGHLGAVRALCEVLSGEEAALLNDRGINALMIAAFAGRMPVVEYLAYEGRLEIEVTDAEGLTCLHHGAAGGRAEVVRYLQGLDGAPSLVKRKTANGQTALHKAAMGSTPGHVECVQLLSGVAANQLHPMQPDNESMDVLLLAAAHGSLPVVQCLSKVVEVDMRAMSGSGQGVIHMAAMMGHLHVLRYLIEELGLDGNAPDNRGWTALHFAASQAREVVVHYLVAVTKLDVWAQDMEGQAAADVAQAGGYTAVEDWLRERMGASGKPRVVGHTVNKN